MHGPESPDSDGRVRKRRRLFLVDGSALLYRAHFAFLRRPLTTSWGQHVGALFGFTSTLLALRRDEEAEYIAVVFDPPGPTFRHDIYPQYKAHRPEMPSELKGQFPLAHRLVDSLSWRALLQDGLEADDLIGSLARQAAGRDWDAVIVSGDKDFAQLIGGAITQYIPSRGREPAEWVGPQEVVEKWGVRPEQFIDFLALTGDSSDNVPGVKGIGPKSAAKLLQVHGNLDRVYANLAQVEPGGMRRKLEEGREQAYLSRDLVSLRTDVEVAPAESFRVADPAEQGAFQDFLEEMEFHALAQRVFGDPSEQPSGGALGAQAGAAAAGAAERGAGDASAAGAGAAPEDRSSGAAATGLPRRIQVADGWDAAYTLITTPGELQAVIRRFPGGGGGLPGLSIDTETDSTAPLTAKLVGLSFGWEAGRAWYVPVGHDQEPRLPLEAVRESLGRLLADAQVTKMGQNLKFDLHLLRRHGLPVAGPLWDTMVASYVRDPETRHGLDALAAEFLDHAMIPIHALIGTGRQQVSMGTLPPAAVAPYACEDADAVVRLMPLLARNLDDVGARELFLDLEMPLLPVLLDMESTGIGLDRQVLAAMSGELEAEQSRLSVQIHNLAGGVFNINSPKQLQVILFEQLKLPAKRKTKTGYSTSQDVLEELAVEHPLPAKILEYRQLSKLQSTYVEALPRMVSPSTGRIHAHFHQTVAATGRLSSSDPNLQNIPIRTPLGRRVRRAFAAPPGRCLLSADYSQIELRILAHLSQDDYLTRAFCQGADIHRATAARVFGVGEEQVDAAMRSRAKTVNFGILYGMGAQRLAREQGIPVKEAAAFIQEYFAKLPGVKVYIDACVETGRSRGYVETLLGRRRYLPNLLSGHHGDRSAAERMALNTPVQGSAADLIKRAMIRLHRRLAREHPDVHLLLQVHDELLLELPEAKAAEMAALVKDEMSSVFKLAVPLKVDAGWGKTWYDAHA